MAGKGSETVAVFVVRRLRERCLVRGEDPRMAFVDLERACTSGGGEVRVREVRRVKGVVVWWVLGCECG